MEYCTFATYANTSPALLHFLFSGTFREIYQSWLTTVLQFACSNDQALVDQGKAVPFITSLHTMKTW